MNAPATPAGRTRLDELLVARAFFDTRSRARDAILRGTVAVDGSTERRPGARIADTASIAVDDPARRYVARSALKLAAALDHFGLDPAGALALDIGASTGGFTQVLLERGARRVIAVDVGHGQLHESLAGDPRVLNCEGVNARSLSMADIEGTAPDFLAADLSFISLKQALPAALNLAAPGACGVFLVKPQFEAGRDAIGKGGLLREASEGARIADGLAHWLNARPGWRTLGVMPSPITGGDGNQEFLMAGAKDQ